MLRTSNLTSQKIHRGGPNYPIGHEVVVPSLGANELKGHVFDQIELDVKDSCIARLTRPPAGFDSPKRFVNYEAVWERHVNVHKRLNDFRLEPLIN
jgi:hypothetical protein